MINVLNRKRHLSYFVRNLADSTKLSQQEKRSYGERDEGWEVRENKLVVEMVKKKKIHLILLTTYYLIFDLTQSSNSVFLC